jgi:hypothetical protein
MASDFWAVLAAHHQNTAAELRASGAVAEVDGVDHLTHREDVLAVLQDAEVYPGGSPKWGPPYLQGLMWSLSMRCRWCAIRRNTLVTVSCCALARRRGAGFGAGVDRSSGGAS